MAGTQAVALALLAAAAPHWPLDLPPVLTSSFGEYRSNHVHAGIDLGTGGRTGAPCRATGDGSVVRMRMSPFGYGKALYVQMDGGPLAVYAHLSRFAAPMAARARAEQEGRRRYTFDITLPPGELRVRRGQVIAWSGQTGVGVPHLHFELRDGDVAQNPQTAGFAVPDTIPPVVAEVVAMPMDFGSHVGGGLETRALPEKGAALVAGGRVGLGVRAWDHATSREHRQGLYRVELRVDGKPLFRLLNERMDYATNHLAVLEYDQERLLERDERVQLLYLRDGDRLAGREAPGIQGGLLVLATGSSHPAPGTFGPGEHAVEVEVADAAGNATVHRARIVATDPPPASVVASSSGRPPEFAVRPVWRARWVELEIETSRPLGPGEEPRIETPGLQGHRAGTSRRLDPRRYRLPVPLGAAGARVEIAAGTPDHATTVPIALDARFVFEGQAARIEDLDPALRIDIPAGALLEDVALRATPVDPASLGLGRELHAAGPCLAVEPRTAALDAPLRIALRPASGDTARAGLFWVNRGGDLRFLSRERDAGGALAGETRFLSRFAVLADTTAPRVVGPVQVRSRGGRLRFHVRDDGARLGDGGLDVELDGDWEPAEWDPETGEVLVEPEGRLARGAHRLVVVATDQVGNRTRRVLRFQVP